MIIAPNEQYITQLRNLVEPETLAKNGYTMQPLTDEELSLKKRCLGCGKTMHQLRAKRPQNPVPPTQRRVAENPLPKIAQSQMTMKMVSEITDARQIPAEPAKAEPPKFRCRFHPGQVVRRMWTCCGRNTAAEPCSGADTHIPQEISKGALAQKYQFHFTPPVLRVQRNARIAVALDCEMGTAVSGDSEPIRVTLIDYFTGEILINNIINPDVPMQHLNTKYSGVSWEDMNRARKQRTCLRGNAGTREALWKHIGMETIVVGHAANNDLRVLRWIHGSVVDSLIIESARAKRAELKRAAEKEKAAESSEDLKSNEAGIRLGPSSAPATGIAESSVVGAPKPKAARKPGQLSLKTLAKLRLGRDIQTGGKKGHDSFEDAVAARDLVHWNIMNPEEEFDC